MDWPVIDRSIGANIVITINVIRNIATFWWWWTGRIKWIWWTGSIGIRRMETHLIVLVKSHRNGWRRIRHSTGTNHQWRCFLFNRRNWIALHRTVNCLLFLFNTQFEDDPSIAMFSFVNKVNCTIVGKNNRKFNAWFAYTNTKWHQGDSVKRMLFQNYWRKICVSWIKIRFVQFLKWRQFSGAGSIVIVTTTAAVAVWGETKDGGCWWRWCQSFGVCV